MQPFGFHSVGLQLIEALWIGLVSSFPASFSTWHSPEKEAETSLVNLIDTFVPEEDGVTQSAHTYFSS